MNNNEYTVHPDKVTPFRDITWYVKWFSSIVLILAVAFRAVEEMPKIIDIVLSWIGAAGWLWVGWKWHDRALMILNSVVLFMLTASVIRFIGMHVI